jgi:LysR family transcriptional regulator, transcriptional activator of nhaA
MYNFSYQHLYYFWIVVRMESFSRAAEALYLAQPTVSTQVKLLEDQLGKQLLMRGGKTLSLTPAGEIAFAHAEKIFSEGQLLIQNLNDHSSGRSLSLKIGASETVPKALVATLLKPIYSSAERLAHITYLQEPAPKLLANLASRDLDLILTDAPLPRHFPIKAYNHLIGQCGVSFLATKTLTRQLGQQFPKNLHRAPFLMPFHGSPLRSDLERWFARHHIEPHIRGTFQDTSVMKAMGEIGAGVIAVPAVVEGLLKRSLRLEQIGYTAEIEERLYLISIEKKIKDELLHMLVDAGKDIYLKLSVKES